MLCSTAVSLGFASFDALWALDTEQKAKLVPVVVARYPKGYRRTTREVEGHEAEILSHPLTYILAVLLFDELPGGDTLFSASQILEELGFAATRNHKAPISFVLGRIQDVKNKGASQTQRGRHWATTYEPEAKDPALQLAAAQALSSLSPKDRETLADEEEGLAISELAERWNLTIDGAKKRLLRARIRFREAIQNFL